MKAVTEMVVVLGHMRQCYQLRWQVGQAELTAAFSPLRQHPGHSWSKEATRDFDLLAPGKVLNHDMSTKSGSHVPHIQ